MVDLHESYRYVPPWQLVGLEGTFPDMNDPFYGSSQEPGGWFCHKFGKELELVAGKRSHVKEMIVAVEEQNGQCW
jgi:hypothetical protein